MLIGLLAALLVTGGCGTTKEQSTVVRTVTAPPAPTDTSPAATSTPTTLRTPRCSELAGEGLCQSRGDTIKVVYKSTQLTLPELNVSLGELRTAKTISSDIGTTAARGTYVIVPLTVTNKLDQPVAFDQDREQVLLGVGETTYTEDFEAENQPGMSFEWNSEPIQPGLQKTGSVIFDLPNTRLPRLQTDGYLEIRQFSDASFGNPKPKRTIGAIRTYG